MKKLIVAIALVFVATTVNAGCMWDIECGVGAKCIRTNMTNGVCQSRW